MEEDFLKKPRLENISYEVDSKEGKYVVSTEQIKIITDLEMKKKPWVQGVIRIDKVVGKSKKINWGGLNRPLYFNIIEEDKKKLTSHFAKHKYMDYTPFNFKLDDFKKFYGEIQRLALNEGEVVPKKEEAELFFKKTYDTYKKSLDDFVGELEFDFK